MKVRVELPPLQTHYQYNLFCSAQTKPTKVKAWHLPVVGKEGELCCTAFSSSRSLSSSERLLPRAEVMAAVDESEDFCLFGKLTGTHTEKRVSYR